jgi:hypothetical protein
MRSIAAVSCETRGEGVEESAMSHAKTKHASKRKRRSKAMPMLGAAGLSLALAGGASATTGEPGKNTPTRNTVPDHEMILGDEEISDVSLATFYVFDKENVGAPLSGIKLAAGRGGGCGCGRGCGGCRGGIGGCVGVGGCAGWGCRGCRGCGGGCGFGLGFGCGWGGCGGCFGWGWGSGGCCLSWGGCNLC